MVSAKGEELDRLVNDAHWALDAGLDARDLVPMMEKVRAAAAAGSEPQRFAKRHLARLLVASDPWKAARFARELIVEEGDAEAHGLLGLAQTLLGNYRSAVKAYHQALALDPDSAVCRHNLGHLLDVAMGRPRAAMRHLAHAWQLLPEAEVGGSYAHALARVGDLETARAVLQKAVPELDDQEREAQLDQWSVPAGEPNPD